MRITDEIIINNKKLPNRVVIQPMEGCDGNKDGSIGELTARRYMRFVESRAALIWFEAVAVCPEGRANPRQLHINKDNLDVYKKIVKEIKEKSLEINGFEPTIVVQLTHSGRYSRPYDKPQPIIAYHNSVFEKGKEDFDYTIATDDYCKKIVNYYGDAVKLACEAGFDGLDIKCCHGYLFDEFLSAYDREGEYGGNFENRSRLFLECVDKAFENKTEDVFVTTRLNMYDGFDYPYGFGVDKDNNIDVTETKQLIEILNQKGVELVNLTLGNPYMIPHVNRPYKNDILPAEVALDNVYKYTKEIKNSFPNMKFIMSALTYYSSDSIENCNKFLDEKVCDMVGFGRMAFAYPQFYRDYVENGEIDRSKCCLMCGKCTELMRAGSVSGCPIRDKEVYMPLYKKYVLKKED